MGFMNVNKEKCGHDGACARVCPVHLIEMDKLTNLPCPVEWAEKSCIKCGHCVAVCRTGALSLSSVPLEKCQPLPDGWQIPIDITEKFFKARRSIRAYKDEPVSRGKIEKLIDVARYAPSGINRQPVYWAVVYEKDKMRELEKLVVEWMRALSASGSPLAESLRMDNIVKMYDAGLYPILRDAPHLIIAYALKEDMTAPQSATIALTYMELAAASMGLGACWAGYVVMAINMHKPVRQLIGLSNKTDAFGALMIGHPKYKYWRIPPRNDPHIIWR